MAKVIRGNFASYALDMGQIFMDDEAAIDEAFDEMFSMCGNAGQESLIGDYAEHFYEWAHVALEHEVADGTTWSSFAAMVIYDWYAGDTQKFNGTDIIWAQGWIMIARQSGYHDSEDEYGEGAGQEF